MPFSEAGHSGDQMFPIEPSLGTMPLNFALSQSHIHCTTQLLLALRSSNKQIHSHPEKMPVLYRQSYTILQGPHIHLPVSYMYHRNFATIYVLGELNKNVKKSPNGYKKLS